MSGAKPNTADFVIVGAGITGAATAYYLAKAKAGRVVLLDRGQPAAGGTGQSAAIVRQHYSNDVLLALARDSVAIFKSLPEETGYPMGYVRTGWCMLLPKDVLAGAKKNLERQKALGIESRMMSAEAARDIIPGLNPDGVAGVAYEPDGGFADPHLSTRAYVKAFADLGGEVRLATAVRRLTRQGDRVSGVVTDTDDIAAGMVVNAAGPWAGSLARTAAIETRLTVTRELDTIWISEAGRPVPTTSISNAVDAIYLRPMGYGRYTLGRGFPKDYETVDPDNYRHAVEDDFVADVRRRVENRFAGMKGMRLADTYAALYDVSPDWYPVSGVRDGLAGYADAWGGSGHGFKIAPALARGLATSLLQPAENAAIAGLGHDRFSSGALFSQAYGGNRG